MPSNVPIIFPNPVQFNVDWDRTQRYLQIADARYTQGVQKIRSFYDSVFNSPMIGEDNIKRRDQYLNQIANALKNSSHLDFSQLQNQDFVYNLITPIASDPGIANDIRFTLDLKNKSKKNEQYRTSSDPNVRRRYSEDYAKALNYMAEDFKNATPDKRFGMSLPEFVENIDLMSYANKLYKEYGISVKQDTPDGPYIWTQKNGELALPLTEAMVSDMLSNDPAVKSMLELKSYVQRRDAVQQALPQFNNDKDAAERDYLTKTINSLKTAKQQQIEENNLTISNLKDKIARYDQQIRLHGMIRNSPEHKDYLANVLALEKAEKAAESFKNSSLEFEQIDMNNLDDMRSTVDNLNSSFGYLDLANSLSRFLAYKDSEISVKPNQFEQARLNQELILQRQMEIERIRHINRENEIRLRASLRPEDDDDDDENPNNQNNDNDDNSSNQDMFDDIENNNLNSNSNTPSRRLFSGSAPMNN